MENPETTYIAFGGIILVGLLLLIFFYYRMLIREFVLQNDWFGKNVTIRLFNIGLASALFSTLLNAFVIAPFVLAFRLISTYVPYVSLAFQSAPAAHFHGATGDSGNLSLFRDFYNDLANVFVPFSENLGANALNIALGVIFLIMLSALEYSLLWNDTSKTYSVNHLAFGAKKTLGLLVVILIGFYLLFIALVATSKISTSTYDPHITLTHLDSLLKNDVNPDDIKKTMVTDTAINTGQLKLQLFQLDTTVKSALARKIQFPDYPDYKSAILSATENATRNYRGLISAQSQQVSKLLAQLNTLQTQVNNAYTENSVKLTNPEREKYVGQLSDYYTNNMQSGIDELSRTADYIQNVHTEVTGYFNALFIQLNENINQVKAGSLRQFPVLPYPPGESDFGNADGYQKLSGSIPLPDKPSADWGFVGSISSWLTDTTSLNLAIIIGMLGFGIFGAGISTFITKEVETGEEEASILESMTRVVVKGFSAALVIYLVAKSGLALVNNSNSDPNPYFLYFSCLAGAVFSDRIWDWARSIIDKNYNPSDGNQPEKLQLDDKKQPDKDQKIDQEPDTEKTF